MRIEHVIQDLERMGERLEPEIRDVLDLAREDALATAFALSSGPLSLAEMARRPEPDHPYAKRRGQAKRDPGVINVQGGSFRENWDSTPVASSGGVLSTEVFNADPVGPYLEQKDGGPKSHMVPRPIGDGIAERVVPRLDRWTDEAVERVLG